MNNKLLVIAIVGNKSDLIDKEEVDEVEARSFAKQIGAIYRQTSVITSSGIEDLFRAIGSKYFDPTYKEETEIPSRKNSIQLKNNKEMTKQIKHLEENKKKCCFG